MMNNIFVHKLDKAIFNALFHGHNRQQKIEKRNNEKTIWYHNFKNHNYLKLLSIKIGSHVLNILTSYEHEENEDGEERD